MKNPTCRHIVFGACHDNGYVRVLEDFVHEPAIVEKITLLHSFSVGGEFRKLPFQSVMMGSVLRTSLPGASAVQTTVESPTEKTAVASHSSATKTWASLAKAGENNAATLASVKAHMPQVLVNAAGQRIDVKLPRPPQAAIASWNHKTKVVNMKYCRKYQLNGGCEGVCNYSHGPLSDDERLVYQLILKREVCNDRLKCRDLECFYGHNCSCKKLSCKFPREMHGIDDATAKVWIQNWAECS